MPPVSSALRQQVIDWAFAHYATEKGLPSSTVEYGLWLWTTDNGAKLDPEAPIVGKAKSVDLYSYDRLFKLVRA